MILLFVKIAGTDIALVSVLRIIEPVSSKWRNAILRFLGKRVPKPQIVAPAERKESFATKVLPISFRPFHSPSDKRFTCKAAITSARVTVRREFRRPRQIARAGFVPLGLGPKSGIIGNFPAARMLRRFARAPIRTTATDRSPSDSAGCSRLPLSVRTTGHELIRSPDEPSDFAVGNIPVETDTDPMPFVHMVAGLYALVAVPQIDRLVRVALQTTEIELADIDETEPLIPHAEYEQIPVVLRARLVERHLVAGARERKAVCPEFFYIHFDSSESACRFASSTRGIFRIVRRGRISRSRKRPGNLPKRAGPQESRGQGYLSVLCQNVAVARRLAPPSARK